MTIEGYVEQVRRDKITGWVVDRRKTNRRLVVELCVAGRHVAAVAATIARPDLAALDVNGRIDFAFELAVPSGTRLDLDHMAVRVIGADAPLPVVAGATRLEGVVDFFAGAMIGGWAWRVGRPKEHVEVTVRHKGRAIAKTLADSFRQDLLEVGIGEGSHAFLFDVGRLADQETLQRDKVDVVFEATGQALFSLLNNQGMNSPLGNRVNN